jgi:ribosomal protein S18 acetylase RimI-like enzyme
MVRLAAAEDVQAIARIHVASWSAGYSAFLPAEVIRAHDIVSRAAMWKDLLDLRRWPMLVAEDGSNVVGFCHIMESRDADCDGSTGEITALYVAPAAWRRGHGRRLCTAAERELALRGLHAVTLWVFEKNEGGKGFYEACGFRRDCAQKLHHASGELAARYRKALPSIVHG